VTVLHTIVQGSRRLSKLTRQKYLLDLDRWEEFAGTSPTGWTRYRAQEFYDKLIEIDGVKPQTANRIMSAIRYAAKWWAHRENNPSLDFAHVETQRKDDTEIREALSQEDATKLILACVSPGERVQPIDLRDLALVVTGLETGMRRMSLAGMMFDRITTKFGYPSVFVPVKGHKEPVSVPLSDTVMLVLEAWKKSLGSLRGPVFQRLEKRLMPRKGLVYDGSGDSVSERMVHKIVHDRGVEAGLPNVYPHVFRHTFVTWRLQAQMSDVLISSITWHTLPKMGAMESYIDRYKLGGDARNATPGWLSELVKRLLP
jgi:site-specific recombinase XerD